jgi:ubiquinone/menaquinone biosynthesis C-methylase UbiE
MTEAGGQGRFSGVANIVRFSMRSLVVSWYVYDHARVTRWQWLPERIGGSPYRWANIHAGLDESTSSLRQLFPGSNGRVVDIYDSEKMTEPSIARARRIHPSAEPFERGRYDALPLPDNDCDAVFLLFAAHKVRAAGHRTLLLRETARLLREGGAVVLVEHLRTGRTFLLSVRASCISIPDRTGSVISGTAGWWSSGRTR